MRCSQCGRQLPDDSVFCVFCGARLTAHWPEDSTTMGSLGGPPSGGTYAEDNRPGAKGSPVHMDTSVRNPSPEDSGRIGSGAVSTGIPDSYRQYMLMQKRLEEQKKAEAEERKKREAKRAAKRKKTRKITRITLLAVFLATAITLGSVYWLVPELRYQHACTLMEDGEYDEAQDLFEDLSPYSESQEMIKACQYGKATELMAVGEYEAAIQIYLELGQYEDSETLRHQCYVAWGNALYESGNYTGAIDVYKQGSCSVANCENFASCYYELMLQAMSRGDWQTAYDNWGIIQGVKEMGDYSSALLEQYIASLLSENTIASCNKVQTLIADLDTKYRTEAITALEEQCAGQILELKYLEAVSYYESGNRLNAIRAFEAILDYKDAAQYYEELTRWEVTVVFNNYIDNWTEGLSSVSRSKTLFIHINVAGGKPGEMIPLSYVFIFPDGYTTEDDFYEFEDGETGYLYWDPDMGGTATIKIYNADTGELLCRESVYIN